MPIEFGDIVRRMRLNKRLSLRDVCRVTNSDPSNWSKVERGILPPPNDEKSLGLWATALELEAGTEEYQVFMDAASIARGRIPQDIMDREDIMEHIPAFFRTIRGQKPSEEDIDKLIELLKKS